MLSIIKMVQYATILLFLNIILFNEIENWTYYTGVWAKKILSSVVSKNVSFFFKIVYRKVMIINYSCWSCASFNLPFVFLLYVLCFFGQSWCRIDPDGVEHKRFLHWCYYFVYSCVYFIDKVYTMNDMYYQRQ